jgi:hypothetical protein
MKYKHITILVVFIIFFLAGIILILKSDTWSLGSIQSMNLAGSIISIFSGIGFIIEYSYKNK